MKQGDVYVIKKGHFDLYKTITILGIEDKLNKRFYVMMTDPSSLSIQTTLHKSSIRETHKFSRRLTRLEFLLLCQETK